jgi:serine protease AprX
MTNEYNEGGKLMAGKQQFTHHGTLDHRRRPSGRRRGSAVVLALAGILAVSAATSVGEIDPIGNAAPVPAADSGSSGVLSLSMVDLLGTQVTGDPVTLAELVEDVTGIRQRQNGSDGTGVDIALIDSGVAPVAGLDGPNVVHGPDLSGEGAFAEVAYLDSYGHGTHLAGIMVGQRDGSEGIAPGARVVSVKVAGADGVTSVAQVVAGIDWVVEHRNTDGLNIRVLNLALGQAGVSSHQGNLLSAAVERAWDAGIFVVVAAGNRGANQTHLDAPAIDPYVMSVGAVDSSVQPNAKYQQPTGWTARGNGNRNPDIAAPGVSIASYRVPGSTVDQLAPGARYGEDFFLGSGTSQSAAVVSAIAARLLGDYPAVTPVGLKATFEFGSITRLSPVPVLTIGEGVVQGGKSWNNPQYSTPAPTYERAAGPGKGIVAPTGATWSGGGWSGATWSGATWSGATWSGASWSGASWSGASWSGATWSGASWSGASWSGASWSGASWSGASWSGATWSGSGWS